jgi:hypothetical protein
MTSSLEIRSSLGIVPQKLEPESVENCQDIEYPVEPAEETGADAILDYEEGNL